MSLLDAVTEGLADANSAGVRDICASATRELLDWSMRQRPDDKIGGSSKKQTSATAITVMRRLLERLAHPEPYMRSVAPCHAQTFVLLLLDTPARVQPMLSS